MESTLQSFREKLSEKLKIIEKKAAERATEELASLRREKLLEKSNYQKAYS